MRNITVLGVLTIGWFGLVWADPIDDAVNNQLRKQKIPGLALVIVKDGKVAKAAGYGVSDRRQNTPVTPETVFKIASVSKQFISGGILLLVQQGKLTIDEPVTKYLDGAPEAWNRITIRHALTHTSGLPREGPAFAPFKPLPDAEIIRSAYAVPLRFEPGEKWEYCNTGYYILAEIIRKVSGQPWTAFLQEQFFAPAGMKSTLPTNTNVAVPNRAKGYSDNDKLADAPDWTSLRPSGAFLSTVIDLAEWEAALRGGNILTSATQQQMWTPVQLNSGATHPYGFGWVIGSMQGHRLIHHAGGLPGFRSEYARFVDDGVAIIFLANLDDVDPMAILADIAPLVLNAN